MRQSVKGYLGTEMAMKVRNQEIRVGNTRRDAYAVSWIHTDEFYRKHDGKRQRMLVGGLFEVTKDVGSASSSVGLLRVWFVSSLVHPFTEPP